jgi:hypothetical protein
MIATGSKDPSKHIQNLHYKLLIFSSHGLLLKLALNFIATPVSIYHVTLGCCHGISSWRTFDHAILDVWTHGFNIMMTEILSLNIW